MRLFVSPANGMISLEKNFDLPELHRLSCWNLFNVWRLNGRESGKKEEDEKVMRSFNIIVISLITTLTRSIHSRSCQCFIQSSCARCPFSIRSKRQKKDSRSFWNWTRLINFMRCCSTVVFAVVSHYHFWDFFRDSEQICFLEFYHEASNLTSLRWSMNDSETRRVELFISISTF